MSEVVSIIVKGGVVMIPLLACSPISLALGTIGKPVAL
jgi:hypothetical protein